jgi:hypothetical protein
MRDRLDNSEAAVERLNGRIGRLGPGSGAARFRRHQPMIYSLADSAYAKAAAFSMPHQFVVLPIHTPPPWQEFSGLG